MHRRSDALSVGKISIPGPSYSATSAMRVMQPLFSPQLTGVRRRKTSADEAATTSPLFNNRSLPKHRMSESILQGQPRPYDIAESDEAISWFTLMVASLVSSSSSIPIIYATPARPPEKRTTEKRTWYKSNQSPTPDKSEPRPDGQCLYHHHHSGSPPHRWLPLGPQLGHREEDFGPRHG